MKSIENKLVVIAAGPSIEECSRIVPNPPSSPNTNY